MARRRYYPDKNSQNWVEQNIEGAFRDMQIGCLSENSEADRSGSVDRGHKI
jgi:hypothetical protein